MKLSQLTESGRIYLQQINNYLQKGQGYPQIRSYLLKQLNEIHPDNFKSDDKLIPTIVQRLRKQIISESNQNLSRAIDILEDLLKYANQVTQPYICTQEVCQSLFIAIAYRKIIVLNKVLYQQNQLRLSSIVLYYYHKFQANPRNYTHIFKLYKDLKERNCEFPKQSFIVIPKNNQFRKASQKNSDQQRHQKVIVSVSFDSIKEFVQQTEKQFNFNKLSCANTQFVRALKIKAKTIFDISQNQQKSIVLNNQEKQQAKVLYKIIRTMLKQIQKINEQNIKQDKIKSQKQFTQEKIQQITPNNKKDLNISTPSIKSIKKYKQKQSLNLLDINQAKPVPSLKKTSSLLDEEEGNDQIIYINSGLLDIGERGKSFQSPKKQVPSIKKLTGPPKYEDLLVNDNTLVAAITSSPDLIKPSIQNLLQSDQQSLHAADNLSQKTSQNSGYVFNNEQLFNQFQIINRFKSPNNYNTLLNDVDFSDQSSQSNRQGNKVKFEVDQNNTDIFDNNNDNNIKRYDLSFTPKKQNSLIDKDTSNKAKSTEIQHQKQSLSLSANYKNQSTLSPDYHFGVLADTREVKAYDYVNTLINSNYSNDSRSIGKEQDEENMIKPTPSKHTLSSHKSAKQMFPEILNFNNFNVKGDKNNKKIILKDKQDENDDDEFEQYQKGGESLFDTQNELNQIFQTKENKYNLRDKKTAPIIFEKMYIGLDSSQSNPLKNNQLLL